MQMSKLVLLAVVALVCTANAQDSCKGDDYGTAGDFDFYVFEESWPAGFCQTKGFQMPGCLSPTAYMQKSFTIHGLWPNYNQEREGHEWPQCCDSQYGPDVNSTVEAMLSDQLHQYWPDEGNVNWPNYEHSELLSHEWNKHGTCAGLDQYTYYTAAMNISVALGTPDIISSNVGSSVALSDLYSAFGAQPCVVGFACDISIDCENQGLLGITTCWKKDLSGRMTCPGAVITKANCPDSVQIVSFSGDGTNAAPQQQQQQQQPVATMAAAEHERDLLRHRLAVLRRTL